MQHERLINRISLVGLLIVLSGLIIVVVYAFKYAPVKSTQLSETKDAPVIITLKDASNILINGIDTPDDEQAEYPFAVMIDNSADAGSPHGLQQARVVYETVTEAGITRYMALFQNSNAEKIGPVRSARDYYVPWVGEWNADYVHSGGSPKALRDIRTHNIKDLEEISYLGNHYFWRDDDLVGSHDLLTSSKLLREARTYKKLPEYEETPHRWKFYSADPEVSVDTLLYTPKTVSVDWRIGEEYDVRFEYDASKNIYNRFMDDAPDLSASGEQFTVRNLIIQHVPRAVVLDNEGRVRLDTTGSGEMTVMRNGEKIDGTWVKSSREAQTLYYDAEGEEVVFVPGLIWIAVVPNGRAVEFR